MIYWGVKVLKGKWSESKTRNTEIALGDLIDQYHVDTLVLKKLHSSRTSKNLNSLVRSIEILAKKKGIMIYRYSLDDIKQSLGEGMKINKMALAGVVTARYPFLVHE